MIKPGKGILRIGTSNVVVPGNKQAFPPEFRQKSRLTYYSTLFNSVEINSTFYKVPMPATFEKWAAEVPESFRFTVKLWKEITHVKYLDFKAADLTLFYNAINRTGNKKGCLLIQFPGSTTLDSYAQVEQLLARCKELDPEPQWRIAIEFRSKTWYTGETYELLDQYGASLVLHDMPKSKHETLNKAAGFVYIRFHGVNGDYTGSYTDDQLGAQAQKVRHWLNEGKDVYVYFNNTIGDAFQNALYLKGLTEQ
ncbi:MAG: DUF72 domain-containing protein [Williamsia sp.]|nr:DUF72 domain-containing protein [Williamsia sp.]